MARTLAQLKAECDRNGLSVVQTGREAKGPYEKALREFYWNRDFPGREMPPQLHPMLARNIKDVDETTAKHLWESPSWVAQEKIDGCRLLMFIGKDGSTFTSRRLSDRTYRYSENTEQLPHLNKITGSATGLTGTVLDGEVVCMRHDVNTGAVVTKNGLQATVALLAIDPKESERIQREQNAWLVFKVFDILMDGGKDVTRELYCLRMQRLNAALLKIAPYTTFIHSVEVVSADKKEYYETVVKRGGEGIMLKDLKAPYEASSSRTKAMYKVKRFEEYDLFVTGFVPGDPAKGWDKLIGGLECSAYNVNSKVPHITAVPINLTLEDRIQATVCPQCKGAVVVDSPNIDGKRVVTSVRCPVHGELITPDLNPNWLNKVYVVRGQEFTARVLRLKHAVIMSERYDKPADECTIDVAAIEAKFASKGEETGVRL